jgi:hypothetical protein
MLTDKITFQFVWWLKVFRSNFFHLNFSSVKTSLSWAFKAKLSPEIFSPARHPDFFAWHTCYWYCSSIIPTTWHNNCTLHTIYTANKFLSLPADAALYNSTENLQLNSDIMFMNFIIWRPFLLLGCTVRPR